MLMLAWGDPTMKRTVISFGLQARDTALQSCYFQNRIENVIKTFIITATIGLWTSIASAQSLSIADIERMLDEQTANANPYAALLNNPDPVRSLGAMRIMMESGDPQLVDLALEFGLLASDARVRREAVEFYIATKPLLSVLLNGSNIDDGNFKSAVVNSTLYGIVDTANIGYATLQIGEYDQAKECYIHVDGSESCAFRFDPNGIFLLGRTVSAKLEITDAGQLVGDAELKSVDGLVPLTINILD